MTDSSFVHAIATRIGIGVYDEQWFAHRFPLFEAITVPSLRRQTSQDFDWLWVVDRQMPPHAANRLAQIAAKVPNAVIVPVEFKTSLKAAVVDWGVTEAAKRGAGHVMTSRLDDDDALALGMVERLHEEAAAFLALRRPGKAVFSFTVGTMWIPAERVGYTRYHDSLSTGLTVLEEVDSVRGIYDWPHQEIKQRIVPAGGFVRGVDDVRPWWMYAAHLLSDSDTGDLKRLKKVREHRYGYRIDDELLARFGMDPAAIDGLAELPDPQVVTPVKRLAVRAMEIEREIVKLRGQLDDADTEQAERVRARIAELETQRHAAGSGLVSGEMPVGTDTAPAKPASSGRRWSLKSKLVRSRSRD